MVSSIIAVLVAAAGMYIVWWVFRGVQHVPAVLNILDLYTFEWKPSEEIGKRIHASKDAAIVAFVNETHKECNSDMRREDFCKKLARELSEVYAENSLVEVNYIAPTDALLEECAHCLRELSSEEIETYKRRWERIVGDGTVRRAVVEGDVVSGSEDTSFDEEEIPIPLLSELQLSEDTPFDEEEIAMLAKILGIVLIRKKPMGKRPPRLRNTSQRQIVAGLSGLGSPA